MPTRPNSSLGLLLELFVLTSTPLFANEQTGQVEIRNTAEEVVLSNGLVQVRSPLTPTGIDDVVDLINGTSLPLEGDRFAIQLEGGRTIRSREMQLAEITTESNSLHGRLTLGYRLDDLVVNLVTDLQAGQSWATRWLIIRALREPGASKQRLEAITLADWRHSGAIGPADAGDVVQALGYPSGCGQVVYAGDFFCALAHPGAENFVREGKISCHIPATDELSSSPVRTSQLVLGTGARRGFLRYIDATRANKARMVFLVNDWYWKDKSQPLAAIEALAEIKRQSGVPVDSFTLDDGWDFDWDQEAGIWGRLHRTRFPGGWNSLQSAARASDMNVSLWFGPIGGYAYRPKRVAFGRTLGYEVQGDKLCLAAPKYRQHVEESFSRWAELGMDYIKVDGFWPDCMEADHEHAVGPGGAVEQMNTLIKVFDVWRRARPELLIGYTSGSNPSPFWLQHADFVWRGGLDDSHAGTGDPFDRHNTYLDICLERHRQTEMPISAFVTFDIVTDRIAGNRDDAFERGFWWLAARTSLHHDWYLQADDLTLDRWQMLARAAQWAKRHEEVFRTSRMIGGRPSQEEIYGFSAFNGQRGTLALRNPSLETKRIETDLVRLLELPEAEQTLRLRLSGVYGHTQPIEGVHAAKNLIQLELPALGIAVFEVETAE